MTKKVIYQDSFLVSGIMCDGCGGGIGRVINDLTNADYNLPDEIQTQIYSDPESIGIHRITIIIKSANEHTNKNGELNKTIATAIQNNILNAGFGIVEQDIQLESESTYTNWINIAINVLSVGIIITLSLVFPPSLPLTIGLAVLSIASTAFTARNYLRIFFENLYNKTIFHMATPISVGWFLSVAHTLYHAIVMPFMNSFAMIAMSYIMPSALMIMINGMDELKRLVINKSKKMHLQGLKNIFPQMADEYECYELSADEKQQLEECIKTQASSEFLLLNKRVTVANDKKFLEEKMLVKVKTGECFPVDGHIIQGSSMVDTSITNGELQQLKQYLDEVPAGAVNLGQEVIVYASNNCYNSTVNRLLFRANRAEVEQEKSTANNKFIYVYGALIILALVVSVTIPFFLGLLTVPLILQNIIGILFAICPCTIAIAHQLPKVLIVYQQNAQKITLRKEHLTERTAPIHTVIFDKTGTLTTGKSQVDCSEGIDKNGLWQRIFLLEKHYGGEHPLAKAITQHCEKMNIHQAMFTEIIEPEIDSYKRGLTARIQNKRIQIGNLQYMQDTGIIMPDNYSPFVRNKMNQGLTPIYIAEEGIYQGIIFIKHEIRPELPAALARLKKQNVKLIMLTGDSESSAKGFNQQNGVFFDENIHIYANQTPVKKEAFLNKLLKNEPHPEGVWFIGDGLNDAPCARAVSEGGGISCAITADDKTAFFSDISLDGTINYLFKYNHLNDFLEKNVMQNQGLLMYGTLAFLAFIITFSVAGIAVSPIIPLIIMATTTLFTLFNSYRVSMAVNESLDKKSSFFRRFLVSDASLILLIVGFTFFIGSILIATAFSGGLAFPAMVFTAGLITALSSSCLIIGSLLMGLVALGGLGYLIENQQDIVTKDNPGLLINPPTEQEQTSVNIRQRSGSSSIFMSEKSSEEDFFISPNDDDAGVFRII